jgi:type IV pilus assembly protein PilO
VTLQFSKNEKKIFLFGILISILIFLFVYFNFLQPLKRTLKSLDNQYKMAEQSYESVINQKTDVKETVIENSQYLQKRLPVEPLINQFILDLEKAETMSNSLIINMSFGTGNEGHQSNAEVEEGQTLEQNETITEPVTESVQPTGIKKITVNLLIQSPNYFDLEKFIETIENLERIVTVESVNFSGSSEVTSLGKLQQPLNYQVSLTLYYMPGIEDLQKDLPKIDSGEPASKRNPLTQFDDLSENTGK